MVEAWSKPENQKNYPIVPVMELYKNMLRTVKTKHYKISFDEIEHAFHYEWVLQNLDYKWLLKLKHNAFFNEYYNFYTKKIRLLVNSVNYAHSLIFIILHIE